MVCPPSDLRQASGQPSIAALSGSDYGINWVVDVDLHSNAASQDGCCWPPQESCEAHPCNWGGAAAKYQAMDDPKDSLREYHRETAFGFVEWYLVEGVEVVCPEEGDVDRKRGSAEFPSFLYNVVGEVGYSWEYDAFPLVYAGVDLTP
jgi:hypothetical protein